MYCIVKRKLILTTLWTSRAYFYILFRFRFLLEFLSSRGTQLRFPPKCIEIGFQAIKSAFWSWEMHSNYSLFGHPSATWAYLNLKGLQYYFPENFAYNLSW